MGALTLPEELKPALAATLSLSDEAFEQFLSQLQSAPMSFSDSELSDNLTASTKLIPPDTISSIVEMLVTFRWVPSSAGVSTDEFLNDLVEAINETDLKDSIDLQPEKIRSRLASLLGAKSIAFAASARQVRRNYERTFCNAEMFTLSRLENAALAKNELVFVNALDATGIENRSAHQLVRIIKLALKAGAFIAARAVAEKGLARFPDNPQFRQYVLSLSVPKVVSQNVPHNPALQANRNWLNENSHEYSGQWVALRNGNLLGASDSFEELFSQIGRSKEILFTRA